MSGSFNVGSQAQAHLAIWLFNSWAWVKYDQFIGPNKIYRSPKSVNALKVYSLLIMNIKREILFLKT